LGASAVSDCFGNGAVSKPAGDCRLGDDMTSDGSTNA
jgi:hypothetical protein